MLSFITSLLSVEYHGIYNTFTISLFRYVDFLNYYYYYLLFFFLFFFNVLGVLGFYVIYQ